MDKEELMLNDWVKLKDFEPTEDDNGYAKITRLERYEVWTDALNEIEYNDIEPIALTKEMLYSNGFKYRTISKSNNEYEEVFTCFDFNVELFAGKLSTRIGYKEIEIKYVHQLQNMLRCAGLIDFANEFNPQ